jgi:hypothetical protein
VTAYANDPRVVANDDGTFTIPNEDCDWLVEPVDGGYIAATLFGAIKEPGDRYNQRARVFDTADEAIAAVIGVPQ